MKLKLIRATLLAVVLLPTSVFGQTLDEVMADRPLSLVGTSTLKVMLFNVFDSALYTGTGQWDEPDNSFRLTLTYKRNLKARWLVRSTGEEWEHLGITDNRLDSWMSELATMWPDINKGDSITLDVDAQGVSRFFYNQNEIGAITDPDFGPLFAAIWLSPDTSQPKHRARLLGE